MSLNLQQMYTTINDAGKIGYENVRKFTLTPSHIKQTKNSKRVTGLNTKPKTIKLLTWVRKLDLNWTSTKLRTSIPWKTLLIKWIGKSQMGGIYGGGVCVWWRTHNQNRTFNNSKKSNLKKGGKGETWAVASQDKISSFGQSTYKNMLSINIHQGNAN